MSYVEKIKDKEKQLAELKKEIDEKMNKLFGTLVNLKGQEYYDHTEATLDYEEIKTKMFQYNLLIMQIDSMKFYDSLHERY